MLCSILILASIGLGVSIIYSDYYFSPVSGLQSFTVADVSRTYLHPEEDAGTPSAAAPSDELYALLERWALENEATILYKNGFAAGCGILDGSDWLREAVGLSLPCDAQGVLTAEDAAFLMPLCAMGGFCRTRWGCLYWELIGNRMCLPLSPMQGFSIRCP